MPHQLHHHGDGVGGRRQQQRTNPPPHHHRFVPDDGDDEMQPRRPRRTTATATATVLTMETVKTTTETANMNTMATMHNTMKNHQRQTPPDADPDPATRAKSPQRYGGRMALLTREEGRMNVVENSATAPQVSKNDTSAMTTNTKNNHANNNNKIILVHKMNKTKKMMKSDSGTTPITAALTETAATSMASTIVAEGIGNDGGIPSIISCSLINERPVSDLEEEKFEDDEETLTKLYDASYVELQHQGQKRRHTKSGWTSVDGVGGVVGAGFGSYCEGGGARTTLDRTSSSHTAALQQQQGRKRGDNDGLVEGTGLRLFSRGGDGGGICTDGGSTQKPRYDGVPSIIFQVVKRDDSSISDLADGYSVVDKMEERQRQQQQQHPPPPKAVAVPVPLVRLEQRHQEKLHQQKQRHRKDNNNANFHHNNNRDGVAAVAAAVTAAAADVAAKNHNNNTQFDDEIASLIRDVDDLLLDAGCNVVDLTNRFTTARLNI